MTTYTRGTTLLRRYTAADGSLIDGGHYHFRYYVRSVILHSGATTVYYCFVCVMTSHTGPFRSSPAVNAARFQDFQDGYTQIYFRDYDNLTTTLVILYYKVRHWHCRTIGTATLPA